MTDGSKLLISDAHPCQASAGDIGARLAIVPLGAEARGLDAAPRLVQRLRSANDHPTAAIVDMIGLQEKAHVAVGACA